MPNKALYQKLSNRFQTNARVSTCKNLRPPNSKTATTKITAMIDKAIETTFVTPANSLCMMNQTVTASVNALITCAIFPVKSMLTGWEGRFDHFMSKDFFGADDSEMITFTSTGINVTGENTAEITGDLTLNGVTKSVVLDAKLNQTGQHPMAGKPWAGFDATTTLLRSDYDLGKFAPFVSDEVEVKISIEAMKAE